MAKRFRGDTLTGGTGDVNPQWFTMRGVESAADTTTTQQIALPIPQIPVGGKATVIEILRMWCWWGTGFGGTGVAETEYQRLINISTKSFGTTVAATSEPTIIMRFEQEKRGAFTAGGTYFFLHNEPAQVDFSDGAGHGILIATPNLYLQTDSANTGIAQTATIKVLYRYKTVTIEEYVGIVQSQQ